MKAQYRLKKNYQYNYVYKHNQSVSDSHIVLLYCASKHQPVTRVGFSVGKKHGNAVCRNKLRRQLKSAMSSIMPTIRSGYNIIVVPRSDKHSYSDILASLTRLVDKAGLTHAK